MSDNSKCLSERTRTVLYDLVMSIVAGVIVGVIVTGFLFSSPLSPLITPDIDVKYRDNGNSMTFFVSNTGSQAVDDLQLNVEKMNTDDSEINSKLVPTLKPHDFVSVSFNLTGETHQKPVYNQTRNQANQTAVTGLCQVAAHNGGRIQIQQDTRIYTRANGTVASLTYTGSNLTYNGHTAFYYTFEEENQTYVTPAQFNITVTKTDKNEILYFDAISFSPNSKLSSSNLSIGFDNPDPWNSFGSDGTEQETGINDDDYASNPYESSVSNPIQPSENFTNATEDVDRIVLAKGVSRNDVKQSPEGGRLLFNSSRIILINRDASTNARENNTKTRWRNTNNSTDELEFTSADNDDDGWYPRSLVVEIEGGNCSVQQGESD